MAGRTDVKRWRNPPAKSEVEDELRAFFALLRHGKLEDARAAIGHKYDDWDSQLWSIWQDTYLIYLEELDQGVEDDSFEGRAWLGDLSWLAELGVDDRFQWDKPGDRVIDGEHLFVNLTYKGKVLDVSGDFSVVKDGDGFQLMREIIHAA
jgi:hypothetical protein